MFNMLIIHFTEFTESAKVHSNDDGISRHMLAPYNACYLSYSTIHVGAVYRNEYSIVSSAQCVLRVYCPDCKLTAQEYFLLVPGRGAGARSIVMSVSVCVCVCLSASIFPEPHVQTSPNVCACYWRWIGPRLAALRYVT